MFETCVMTDDDLWQVEYGHGGWIRATSNTFDGWLYIRLTVDSGRVVPAELYYDGRDAGVGARMLREIPLSNLVGFAAADKAEWLERSLRVPGPNLSLLASHFANSWSRGRKDWVADSMRAQIKGSDRVNPRPGSPPPPAPAVDEPAPLRAPEEGLTDAFLRSVAANRAWALRRGVRPAPELARMAGVSPRTVHGWIAKARDRGFIPKANRGGS